MVGPQSKEWNMKITYSLQAWSVIHDRDHQLWPGNSKWLGVSIGPLKWARYGPWLI